MQHECNTSNASAARVRHEQHGCDKVIHERHECDTGEKF